MTLPILVWICFYRSDNSEPYPFRASFLSASHFASSNLGAVSTLGFFWGKAKNTAHIQHGNWHTDGFRIPVNSKPQRPFGPVNLAFSGHSWPCFISWPVAVFWSQSSVMAPAMKWMAKKTTESHLEHWSTLVNGQEKQKQQGIVLARPSNKLINGVAWEWLTAWYTLQLGMLIGQHDDEQNIDKPYRHLGIPGYQCSDQPT